MLGLESIRDQSQRASTFCLENDLRSLHFSSDSHPDLISSRKVLENAIWRPLSNLNCRRETMPFGATFQSWKIQSIWLALSLRNLSVISLLRPDLQTMNGWLQCRESSYLLSMSKFRFFLVLTWMWSAALPVIPIKMYKRKCPNVTSIRASSFINTSSPADWPKS
jgi:hypothetical protein